MCGSNKNMYSFQKHRLRCTKESMINPNCNGSNSKWYDVSLQKLCSLQSAGQYISSISVCHSPWLCNATLQALDGKEEELGLHIEKRRSRRQHPNIITDTDFADDIALISEHISQAQETETRRDWAFSEWEENKQCNTTRKIKHQSLEEVEESSKL